MLKPAAASMLKVRGRRRAIAMVAERPGIAPTNMPMIVPRLTIKMLKGWRTFVRPNMMFSSTIGPSFNR